MAEFTVKGQWRTESYGHVYTAKAVAETGRVLAVVNIEMPLDVGMDIRDRFGSAWTDEVERAARDQVTNAANGWNMPRQEARR